MVGGRAVQVTAGAVNLLSPALGGPTPPERRAAPVEPGRRGRVVRRRLLHPTSPQDFTTAASAYAPLTNLGSGTYRWTITAKDASGNPIGSASSSFTSTASSRPPSSRIETPEGTGLGKTLTVSAPGWSPGGVSVTTTYQWQRDGGSSGRDRHVVHSGQCRLRQVDQREGNRQAPGYIDGVSTSVPISPTSGDAIANVTAPTITGSPWLSATDSPATGELADVLRHVVLHVRLVARRRPISDQTSTTTRRWLPTWARTSSSASRPRRPGTPTAWPTPTRSGRDPPPVAGPRVSAPSGTGIGAGFVAEAPAVEPARRHHHLPVAAQRVADLRRHDPDLQPDHRRPGQGDQPPGDGQEVRLPGQRRGQQRRRPPPAAPSRRPSSLSSRGAGPGKHPQRAARNVGGYRRHSKYQWLRNGTPIPGATDADLPTDGRRRRDERRSTVLASKTGFSDGSANAAAVAVARLKSTTAGALKAFRIEVGRGPSSTSRSPSAG